MVELSVQHLSDEAVAAFADGVLTGTARERAVRHIRGCLECSVAVRIQREAAQALRHATVPTIPRGLLDRLLSVPQTAPLDSPPVVLGPAGQPMFLAYGPHRDGARGIDDPDLNEGFNEARDQRRGQPGAHPRVGGHDRADHSHSRDPRGRGVGHMARTASLAGAFTVVALGVLGAGVSHASQPVSGSGSGGSHLPASSITTSPGATALTTAQSVRLVRTAGDHVLSGTHR